MKVPSMLRSYVIIFQKGRYTALPFLRTLPFRGGEFDEKRQKKGL